MQQQVGVKRYWFIFGLSIVLLFGFHLWSLTRFPAFFVDEVWNAARAWHYLQTGQNFSTLDAGVFNRLDGYWTFFPLLPTLLFSLALKSLAQPALWPMRLIVLAAGFWLLVMVYALAYRLQRREVALLSLLFCGFSSPFVTMAHLARADTMVAALGFTAIVLYVYNDRHKFWVGMLSGLCIGIAFDFHANAAIYAPALGILYLYDNGFTFWRRRDFWGFMLGGLLGGIFYAAIHIFPYPNEYQTFMRLAFAPSHTPPLMTGSLLKIGDSLFDSFILIISFYFILIPLLLWEGVNWVRGIKINGFNFNRMFVLFLALFVTFSLLVSIKNFYYLILFSPLLDIWVAFIAFRMWGETSPLPTPDRIHRIAFWVLAAGMMLVTLSPLVYGFLILAWMAFVLIWPGKYFSPISTIVYGLSLSIVLWLLRSQIGLYATLFVFSLDLFLTALSVKIFFLPVALDSKTYFKFSFYIIVIVFSVVFSASLTLQNAEVDYRIAQTQLNQIIQPDDTIMASQTYWLGLYTHIYYSWETLIYYQRYAPGISAAEALEAIRPDVLIIDEHMRSFITDQEHIFYEALRIPATPFYAYLDTHAELVAQFDGGLYGDIEVYRFRW